MTIVAMDGKDVVPKVVDSFMLLTGQRLDVLVTANQPSGLYMLRASAYHHHGKMAGMKGKTGTLMIRYKDFKGDDWNMPKEHMIMDHSLVQLSLTPLKPRPPPPRTRLVVLDLDRQVITLSFYSLDCLFFLAL